MSDAPVQLETQPESDQKYFPKPGEKQLTARAIIVGCLVGSVVACTNIYIGLKIGWTFGASIVSAVLGFAVFRLMGKHLSVLETNITQTAGSAAGSMASAAGLVAAIPAMNLLGYKISWTGLVLWSLAVAFLGVFFAVPLRRQMVVEEKLRFPTGTATAETILAMFSDAGEALAKAKVLIYAGLAAGLFTLTSHFVPQLESPPIYKWVDVAAITLAASWGFKLYLGPSLFGAGFLIGPRVCLSLLLGALIAWVGLGPMALEQGWAPGKIMSYKTGARGWLLWPGVALMVSEALMSLAMSWKTFARALTMAKKTTGGDGSADDSHIPNSWWMGGLAAGSVLTATIAFYLFDIHPLMTVVAIALSSVLAIVAVRSVGETDINPIGGMGKVTQLVYGGIAPGAMSTNLMAAAITGAGASQAGDMMQDLKTGHLLGASPRKQFFAQLAGICAGVFFVVPVYALFTTSYEIGGEKLPAPAAFAWKAMAELLAKGFDALPPHAVEAVIGAALVGMAVPLLRKIPAIAKWVPSGLAMGIAFIIPAYYSLVMVYGMLAWMIWRKVNPSAVDKFNFALASGLVAGEGLMGIVNAVLTIAGVKPLT
ncbi:MAG: OPT/YSL family transporter [Myxococcales bacterium]|nr:OPT/YSL family transporter [Myxococcales bacterium]